MESNESIKINSTTDESMKQIPKSFYNSLLEHYYFNKKLMDEMKDTFSKKYNELKNENENLKFELQKYDNNLLSEKSEEEKNLSEIKQSEQQKGGEPKSESSMVSSIFKKKSCSEKVSENKESEKYSQSQSTSYSESIKKIRNTLNRTETLVGGSINETTQYESSSSSDNNNDSSNISTSSFDSSSSSGLDSESISMYSTMEGGTITTMTEDEINKAYKKLNKEMKYYNNKKNVNKNDIKKLNFILDGLNVLDKYKK